MTNDRKIPTVPTKTSKGPGMATGLTVGLAGGGIIYAGWEMAGRWAMLAVIAALLASACLWSSRRGARSFPGAIAVRGAVPAPTAKGLTDLDTPGWVDLLHRSLRHDLPLMVALSRDLPSGGLPAAGLLARHCYLLSEALARHLDFEETLSAALAARADSDTAHRPPGLNAERTNVEMQLAAARLRFGRLYSAELPGGLDGIDFHLARLWVATEDYLAQIEQGLLPEARSLIRENPGSLSSWWDGLSHRGRARILAWVIVATNVRPQEASVGQPAPTRWLLYLGTLGSARRRAARLWSGSAPASRPAPAAQAPEDEAILEPIGARPRAGVDPGRRPAGTSPRTDSTSPRLGRHSQSAN